MAKQKGMRIYLDGTFEEKNYGIDRNKIKVRGKKDKVNFEPRSVLTERKSRWRFWRGAKKLILFVDGALNAITFSEITDQMNPFWTKKEAGQFVKKEMAQALIEYKPMTWAQFVILLIPLGVTIFLLFKIGTHLGAF